MSVQTMAGKTCLITGATSGIGEVTARRLASMGAMVTIVGRSAERAAATVARIKAATGATVEVLQADLSSQEEVQRLADAFRARHRRLDILINNAGAVFGRRRESADGVEMTWALNHMSYFLLTNHLLDMLRASAPARVINVSSDAHRGATINFADPQLKRGYSGWRAYSQSKLANILFTRELARRLDGAGVTANALHPGFVNSNFGSEFSGVFGLLFGLAKKAAAISPEAGAETSVYLATSPEVADTSGQYFDKCRAVSPSPAARDTAAAERLWQISEDLIASNMSAFR